MTRRREEEHLQAAVETELRLRGWKYMHHHDSRRSVPGWPDVFAVKGSRAVAIEIKTMTGRVSREQVEWLDALRLAGIETLVVRLPRDWARIAEVLEVSAFQIDLPDAVLEQLAQRVADILEERGCQNTGTQTAGRWLTVDQAADYIGARPQRVYDLRSSGRLTRHGDGARALVDRDELDRLVEGGV